MAGSLVHWMRRLGAPATRATVVFFALGLSGCATGELERPDFVCEDDLEMLPEGASDSDAKTAAEDARNRGQSRLSPCLTRI